MTNSLGKVCGDGRKIYDIGMYDGADSEYFMELGFRVIAVEANPRLSEAALVKYANQISNNSLTVVNAAVSDRSGEIELEVCGDDLGSSSIMKRWVEKRVPMGVYRVPSTSYGKLVKQFGVPYYAKIDIEGADGICITQINRENSPQYVSFEIGEDFVTNIDHLISLGYCEFKIIDQRSFRSFARRRLWSDRIVRKIFRLAGFADPNLVRRGGRWFKVGHSSGPVPWKSDGRWMASEKSREIGMGIGAKGVRGVWYDLHARRVT